MMIPVAYHVHHNGETVPRGEGGGMRQIDYNAELPTTKGLRREAMQQIDKALSDLSQREVLDPLYYFPRHAREVARSIRSAAVLLGGAKHPARQAAEVMAGTIEAYSDEIEILITETKEKEGKAE